MIEIIVVILIGTFYGLLVGIIPGAGATTGLVALYGLMPYFADDPYLGVIFLMAVVAASTTGDSFTGILLGIPGASSAAATMVDGFPLAQQGRATYAISAAVTTSTINGLLWGCLVFLLLPWYSQLLMILGVPELWAFTILALATVGFISTSKVIRSFVAIAIGLTLGLVGVDPTNNAPRMTLGWFYLQDGIQLIPVVAGLFAIPELLDGLKKRTATTTAVHKEVLEGMRVVWTNRWLALRGGVIGAFIGLLPGLGGAMGDWMAYGSAVASNPNEKFGNGNIKGVIGPEGANNAQKATSMVPTVLFGIPGASFAAVLMGLFMYLNFEMGTPDIALDTQFFESLSIGFLSATVIVAVISILAVNVISKITSVPYKYYFPILLVIITWASMQYTGGWEDLVILIAFSLLGIGAKRYKFSRPAMLMAFILADKVEGLTLQVINLYTIEQLITRPIFIAIMLASFGLLVYSIKRKGRIEYA